MLHNGVQLLQAHVACSRAEGRRRWRPVLTAVPPVIVGYASTADEVRSSDDRAPADAQPSQLWLPSPDAPVVRRQQIVIIGDKSYVLPKRLDADYEIRGKPIGEGAFGVVHRCGCINCPIHACCT